MVLRLEQRLMRGSSADLFADLEAQRVYKLFRRVANERSNRVTRGIFDAECRAYELLRSHPELEKRAPEYFGRVVVTAVRDRSGRNRRSHYLLDCCYAIQFLLGEDVKMFGVPEDALPAVV